MKMNQIVLRKRGTKHTELERQKFRQPQRAGDLMPQPDDPSENVAVKLMQVPSWRSGIKPNPVVDLMAGTGEQGRQLLGNTACSASRSGRLADNGYSEHVHCMR